MKLDSKEEGTDYYTLHPIFLEFLQTLEQIDGVDFSNTNKSKLVPVFPKSKAYRNNKITCVQIPIEVNLCSTPFGVQVEIPSLRNHG